MSFQITINLQMQYLIFCTSTSNREQVKPWITTINIIGISWATYYYLKVNFTLRCILLRWKLREKKKSVLNRFRDIVQSNLSHSACLLLNNFHESYPSNLARPKPHQNAMRDSWPQQQSYPYDYHTTRQL